MSERNFEKKSSVGKMFWVIMIAVGLFAGSTQYIGCGGTPNKPAEKHNHSEKPSGGADGGAKAG